MASPSFTEPFIIFNRDRDERPVEIYRYDTKEANHVGAGISMCQAFSKEPHVQHAFEQFAKVWLRQIKSTLKEEVLEEDFNEEIAEQFLDAVSEKLPLNGDGIARAYFSDHLMKKDADDKYYILARFDFNLIWNQAKTAQKKDFTVRSVKPIATTALLECHKAALLHKTTKADLSHTPTKDAQPFKNFYDKIHQ